MKCIIIEDELMARTSLENLCSKAEDINLIGSFESAESAMECISTSEIELIFLDIEMPGMTGLQLLETLPYSPQIIFTTSNKEYAYDAFEYDVTDFIKKPVSLVRFQKGLEKAFNTRDKLQKVANLSSELEIYIKHEGRLIRIPYHEIKYFENVGDYVKVISERGNYIFHSTIKGLDAQLSNPRFMKIHRSFIINLDQIIDIEDNTIVIDQKVIPISRAHKPVLMKNLNIL